MIRRPPRSTRVRSSAASDVYKRQLQALTESWGNDYEHVKYLQKRIADMEEKLTNVQNTLAEIEYSEEIDWMGKLNE